MNPILKIGNRLADTVNKPLNPLLKAENKVSNYLNKNVINPLLKVSNMFDNVWTVMAKAQAMTIASKAIFNAYANINKPQKFFIEYEEDTYVTEKKESIPYSPTKGNLEEALTSAANVGYVTKKTGTEKKQIYFDAVFKTEHMNQRQITSHPVQNGANISDHSYRMPATLTMEVGVSDVMGGFSPIAAIFGRSDSRSENAFKQILTLENTGKPVTIYTRLKKYSNMVIESVRTTEDFKSLYEWRGQINFQEVIIASGVSKTAVSSNTFVLDETRNKVKQPITTKGERVSNQSNLIYFVTD